MRETTCVTLLLAAVGAPTAGAGSSSGGAGRAPWYGRPSPSTRSCCARAGPSVTGKPTASPPDPTRPQARRPRSAIAAPASSPPRLPMLSVTPPTLATATPLGVATVSTTSPAAGTWRRTLHIAGRVTVACAAAVAAVVVISLGVAAAFLLIAVAAS